jgi:uncharacterized protein (TIGR04255 family)
MENTSFAWKAFYLEEAYNALLGKDNMGNKYRKPFLKSVIFRIDLAQPLSQSKQLVADFHEIIKDVFPNREDTAGIILKATFGTEGKDRGTVKQSQRTVTKYKFSNIDGKIILMLEEEPSNLSLLFNSYNNSDELNKLVSLIATTIIKVYGSILIKRIGLRYINNINLNEGSAFDWALFINNRLISMLDFPPDKGTTSRVLGRIELNKDTHKVQFYFGLANPEYPNRIARKEFVLDYDCYVNEDVNITDVLKTVKILHDEIKILFEISILDGLREKMGVISDE